MSTPPIGFHVTCRLSDSRVIAPTREERRRVARIVLQATRGLRLLAFGVPDNHLHLEHGENRELSGKLARDIQNAVRWQLKIHVRFDPAKHRPIRHQGHLFKAFDYILRQQPHHGLVWDPYHDASNLSDLLGMRVIGRHTAANVRQLLPRVRRSKLFELLRVRDLPEADGPLEAILPAALAALGLNRLVRRSASARAALRAAMVLLEGRLPVARMAPLLGACRETLFRLRPQAPDPLLVRAIRLQLGARQVIAAAPTGAFTSQPPPPAAPRLP